jgi:hypothetical protein
MQDFNRERPPVNEEFGNNLVKTSPLFGTDQRRSGRSRLKSAKSLAIHG